MTSSQDPQFPSRRAARLNERANTTEADAPVVENPQWNVQEGGQFVSPGATPPPAAAPEASTPPAVPTSLNPGRRAAPSTPDAEPLRRPRGTAAPEDFPATQVMQKVDQPQYRYSDYRPETAAATPAPTPPAAPQWTEPYDVTVSTAPAAEAPVAAAPPAAPEAPQASPAPERTMTRRELRALQQQETEPPALQEPPTAALPLFSAPPRTPEELAAATTALPVQPEPEAAAAPTSEPQPTAIPAAPATSATDASLPTAWPFAATPAQPAAPSEPAPAVAEADTPSAIPAEAVFPTQAPEPLANTGLTNALAEFDLLTSGEPVAQAPVEPADDLSIFDIPLTPATPGQFTPEPPAQQAAPETPPAWTPPKGHWSTQLDEEDGEVHETTINRTVGSGSVATSALVLPAIPESTISGPLPSGEIILTGSITLPQTLGSSVASSKLEHSGIDQLFETHDAEVVSTESAPVSAVNAISTRSGSGLGNAPKQQSTRALTALIVAAAVMGVVVVGLLVTALALNVF